MKKYGIMLEAYEIESDKYITIDEYYEIREGKF